MSIALGSLHFGNVNLFPLLPCPPFTSKVLQVIVRIFFHALSTFRDLVYHSSSIFVGTSRVSNRLCKATNRLSRKRSTTTDDLVLIFEATTNILNLAMWSSIESDGVTTSKDVHSSGSPRQSSSRSSYLVQRRKSNVSIILSTTKRPSRAESRV